MGRLLLCTLFAVFQFGDKSPTTSQPAAVNSEADQRALQRLVGDYSRTITNLRTLSYVKDVSFFPSAVSVPDKGDFKPQFATAVVKMARDGKLRLEISNEQGPVFLLVRNGLRVYEYDRVGNHWTTYLSAAPFVPDLRLDNGFNFCLVGTDLGSWLGPAGKEQIEFVQDTVLNGSKVGSRVIGGKLCDVVNYSRQDASITIEETLYFDLVSHLLIEWDSRQMPTKETNGQARRALDLRRTRRFREIKLNPDLAPSVFEFAPPKGAKEVKAAELVASEPGSRK